MSTWQEQYDHAINNPPQEGAILTAEDDAMAVLKVVCEEGKQPFIFGQVSVPEIVGRPTGWFLQSDAEESFFGWKCILMPRARAELAKKFGLSNEIIEVKSLRVIRLSNSGKSLLCEVHRYE